MSPPKTDKSVCEQSSICDGEEFGITGGNKAENDVEQKPFLNDQFGDEVKPDDAALVGQFLGSVRDSIHQRALADLLCSNKHQFLTVTKDTPDRYVWAVEIM